MLPELESLRAGWGAGVQVAFANGRMEEFYVHCNCLTPGQMREAEVAQALAVRHSWLGKVPRALTVRGN